MSDVNISPTISDDQKVVAYDLASDKFILKTDAGGIPEAPTDGNSYLRKGDTASWEGISDNSLIIAYGNAINSHTTTLGTHTTQINGLLSDVGTLQTDVTNLQSQVNGLELKELTDVDDLLAPTDGQALIYETSSSLWKAQTIPTPPNALNDLTDVTISGAAPNEFLRYDGA